MVLVQEEGNSVRVNDQGFERPGLLSTCRQIRKETLQIYYYGNKFSIPTPGYKADSLFVFVAKLKEKGLRPGKTDMSFRGLGTRHEPNWSGLVRWTREYYQTSNYPVPRYPTGHQKHGVQGMDKFIVDGIFALVHGMKGLPWTAVEKQLIE